MGLPETLNLEDSIATVNTPDSSQRYSRGLTIRSVTVMLLLILMAGFLAHFIGVLEGANSRLGTEALPVPVLLFFIPLLAIVVALSTLKKVQILTKAELTCILYGSMIALPLVTMGFWRHQLAGVSTIIRSSDWVKFEVLPDSMWPHGGNILENSLGPGNLTIANDKNDETSSIVVQLNTGARSLVSREQTPATIVPGRPYLLTVLVNATDLGSNSEYEIRLSSPDDPRFLIEPISGRSEAKPSVFLPDGSIRLGFYPLELPSGSPEQIHLELILRGSGSATWSDLRLYDAKAIEMAYKGYTSVSESEFSILGVAERQGVIVVPDRLFSRAGFRYLLGLEFPLQDWVKPTLKMGSFALLIFITTFGIVLIYRKQWLVNERFPLPLAKVPLTLLEAPPEKGGLGNRFWLNPWLWFGFAPAFCWCATKVLAGYYSGVPDLSVSIPLGSYLTDDFWGRTWEGVEFSVFALFLGLGLLVELNVLLSLVVGYLLFRMQYWFGESRGLTTDQDFPYFGHQMLGAYLSYAFLLLIFTRKYLWGVALAIVGKGPIQNPEDISDYRKATGLILIGLAGLFVWSQSLHMSLSGTVVLVGFILILGWIGAKFRAECGLPHSGFNHPIGGQGNYNVPVEVLLLVPFTGGMATMGGTSVLVMTLLTAIILPFAFFNVPGMQLEAIEVGKRLGVRSSQIAWTSILGVVLAILLGGWIYLMSLYGFGAVNYPEGGEFNDRTGAFRTFNAEYAMGQAAIEQTNESGTRPGGRSAAVWAIGFGGLGAGLITILRQLFTGFWFHPVGFIVGPSEMMHQLWGSLFAAWTLRFTVLKIGGASTVREKLIPAAIGIVLAAVAAHILFFILALRAHFFTQAAERFGGLI